MDVPLDSARHPESPILAKSPNAQDKVAAEKAAAEKAAAEKADYWLAIHVQEELVQEANEEALLQFKVNQRLLNEYRSTYDANYPSL
jgi:hypothetical protein